KRLPTEHEWEAAARGRNNRAFAWGDNLPQCGQVILPNDGAVPFAGGCPTQDKVPIAAIGTAIQDVTPDGIHDLGGNVAEWTEDPFVAGPWARLKTLNQARVIRGGSVGDALLARASARTSWLANSSGMNVGFRCAVGAEPDATNRR